MLWRVGETIERRVEDGKLLCLTLPLPPPSFDPYSIGGGMYIVGDVVAKNYQERIFSQMYQQYIQEVKEYMRYLWELWEPCLPFAYRPELCGYSTYAKLFPSLRERKEKLYWISVEGKIFLYPPSQYAHLRGYFEHPFQNMALYLLRR